MSRRILSLGAGVQSSALLILAARGEIECDGVIFADTGVEKPTTYEWIEKAMKPLMKEASLPFQTVAYTGKGGRSIYDYCLKYRVMPSTIRRWCTSKFKVGPISKALNCNVDTCLVGFSTDEARRIKSYKLPYERSFPLIDLGLDVTDCRTILEERGLPLPTKSACYLCPFQHANSWRWLKLHFPDLFGKALEVERVYHERRPDKREWMGLFGGLPLWKAMGNGLQAELPMDDNYGCYSGLCFH